MRMFLHVIVLTPLLLGAQPQGPRDSVREMQRQAAKQASERNFADLKDAAKELADLSRQISAEIEEGGEHVIPARIFENLDKVEKLSKRIRDKAKGGGLVIEFPRSTR